MRRVVDWRGTPWALGNDHVRCETSSNLPNEHTKIATGFLVTNDSGINNMHNMSKPGNNIP